ncbi:hypothetical protein [Halorhodospira halochloris]|uniref:hypothetical protein n=1 Tax=Halorhodospira halochloris TaxID=1052 RepID=UPI001EE792DB|nr:hypothetical protein [Halorhodospira halochloris]MCG5547979.1 hypothetical protein [Halorhodospira halochloris]
MKEEGYDDPQHSPYLAWLQALYCLFQQASRGGPLVFEGIADESFAPDHLADFPLTLQSPAFDFATHLLELMALGYNVESLENQAETGIQALTADDADGATDGALLRMIAEAVLAFERGLRPVNACQFARQAIPLRYRPSFDELDARLRAATF